MEKLVLLSQVTLNQTKFSNVSSVLAYILHVKSMGSSTYFPEEDQFNLFVSLSEAITKAKDNKGVIAPIPELCQKGLNTEKYIYGGIAINDTNGICYLVTNNESDLLIEFFMSE